MAGRPAGGTKKRRVGGRYELKQLVGRGAMAQVYRADDTLRGREVALKMVRHEIVENPTAAARFQREVKAASKLLHPNIVRVYEWGVDDGHAFIAMELIDGEDLFEVIGKIGPLPQEMAVRITIEICKALALAHRKGVIHRDLKPENVMVLPGRPPRIKILDFGIAKLRPTLSDDSWNDETAPRTITKTGTAVGTPSHMAPEQARGAPVDGRTDLYGVGVLLYEMLTGRLPFEGKNPVEIAIKHVREIPLPPQHHRPDLHPRLNGLIVKTLAKSPSMRPSSADAMRATLETLLDELEREERGDDEDDDEMPLPTRVDVNPEVERALAERGLTSRGADDDDDDDEGPTREHSVGPISDSMEIPTQTESRTQLQRRMRARGERDEEPVTLQRASRMVPRIGEVIEDEPTVTFLEPLPDSQKEESTRVIHAPPGLFATDPETLDTITRERTSGPELPSDPSSSRISLTGLTRVSRPTHGPMGTLIRNPDEEAEEERNERERRIAEAVATMGDPLLDEDDDDDDDEEELATEVAAPSPAALAVIEAARKAAQGVKTIDAAAWPGSSGVSELGRPMPAKTLQSAGVYDENTAPPPSYMPTLGSAASPGPPPPPPGAPGSPPHQQGSPTTTGELGWSPPPVPPPPSESWSVPQAQLPAQTPSGQIPSAQPGPLQAGPTQTGQMPPHGSAPQNAWFDPRATGGQMPAQQDLENLLRQMPEPERHTGALIVVVVALIAAIGALVWALTL